MPFPNPATQFKAGPKQVEIARKAAKTYSPKRSIAAKLRWLRKKGLSDENAARIHEMMSNKDLTDMEIIVLLESIRNKANTVNEKEKVARLYLEWRKLRHGAKVEVESKHIGVELKQYKFIIETRNQDGKSDNGVSLETDKKTTDSLPISTRPKDN